MSKKIYKLFVPDFHVCASHTHDYETLKNKIQLKYKQCSKVDIQLDQKIITLVCSESDNLDIEDIKRYLLKECMYTGVREIPADEEMVALSAWEKFLTLSRIIFAGSVVVVGLILPFFVPLIPGFFPWGWILLATVSLAALAYAGFPTFRRAFQSLWLHRRLDMDVVLTVTSVSTWLVSLLIFVPKISLEPFFAESLMIILFRNVSEIFESRIRRSLIKEQSLKEKLLDTEFFPKNFQCGMTLTCDERMSLEQFSVGKHKYYVLDENVFTPVSGKIVKILESEDDFINVCTTIENGEKKPRPKYVNDRVDVGHFICKGRVVIERDNVGDDVGDKIEIFPGDGKISLNKQENKQEDLLTSLSESLKEKQSRKSTLESNIAIVARYYIPIIGLIALTFFAIAFIYSMITAQHFFIIAGIISVVCVFVASCPCSLGVIVPTGFEIAKEKGKKFNLSFERPADLDNINNIKVICIDRTGTITEDIPTVTNIKMFSDAMTSEEMMKLITRLEQDVSHPIANSFAKYATSRHWTPQIIEETEISHKTVTANGVKAQYAENVIGFGDEKLMQELGVNLDGLDQGTKSVIEAHKKQGQYCLFFAAAGKLIGYVVLTVKIREDAQEAIRHWREQGKVVYMLTGCEETLAQHTARSLGEDLIPEYRVIAGKTKEEKKAFIQNIQKKIGPVMMIGDDLNDLPSLAAANVSIAVSNGGNDKILKNVADVSVRSEHPLQQVTQMFAISKQNIAFTKLCFTIFLTYNLIVLPMVGTGVLLHFLPALSLPILVFLANPVGLSAALFIFESVLVIGLLMAYKYSSDKNVPDKFQHKHHHHHTHEHSHHETKHSKKLTHEKKPHCCDHEHGHEHHHHSYKLKKTSHKEDKQTVSLNVHEHSHHKVKHSENLTHEKKSHCCNHDHGHEHHHHDHKPEKISQQKDKQSVNPSKNTVVSPKKEFSAEKKLLVDKIDIHINELEKRKTGLDVFWGQKANKVVSLRLAKRNLLAGNRIGPRQHQPHPAVSCHSDPLTAVANGFSLFFAGRSIPTKTAELVEESYQILKNK